MPRYKKKTITIDAEQFDEGQEPLPEGVVERDASTYWFIVTGLDGEMILGEPGGQLIKYGDWIVTSSDGNRSCYTAEEFNKIYELE